MHLFLDLNSDDSDKNTVFIVGVVVSIVIVVVILIIVLLVLLLVKRRKGKEAAVRTFTKVLNGQDSQPSLRYKDTDLVCI